MRQCSSFFIASFFCFASIASAAAVEYQVTVNTSSIAGTTGSLDFNFNPGPLVSQAASLQVLNFTSNGTLAGGPAVIGNVSGGPLPTTVTFTNGSAFNDYFEDFTFGTKLFFNLIFSGPALTTPDGVSTSGSAFAFSMFSDAAGTIPTLTSDTVNGFAFTVNVNLNGTTTVTDSSAQTTVVTPEPSMLPLMALTFGAWLMLRFALRPLSVVTTSRL
jgi:hypothetical protein